MTPEQQSAANEAALQKANDDQYKKECRNQALRSAANSHVIEPDGSVRPLSTKEILIDAESIYQWLIKD